MIGHAFLRFDLIHFVKDSAFLLFSSSLFQIISFFFLLVQVYFLVDLYSFRFALSYFAKMIIYFSLCLKCAKRLKDLSL